MSEENVTGSRIIAAGRVGAIGSDNEVSNAVSIDVASARNGNTRRVVCINSIQSEPVDSVKVTQTDYRREGIRLPEDNIAFASVGVATRGSLEGTDDDVVNAVSVDVASAGD